MIRTPKIAVTLLQLVIFMAAAQAMPPAQDEPTSSGSTVHTIYVIPGSHWNLGNGNDSNWPPYYFPMTPEMVKLDVKSHIDHVLDACLQNKDLYWTIEALWFFQAWWDNTTEATRREQMLRLVREGRITLSAPTHNYRSAFLSGEETNRICYQAEGWRQDHKLPIDTAVMNDVPGYNWSMVQPFSKSGVRYFVAGANHFMGGKLSIAPKDMPFWWEGPDGSRILTWVCEGYTEGQTRVFVDPGAGRFFTSLGVTMEGVSMNQSTGEKEKVMRMSGPELMEYSIGKEMTRLRKANYPYDAMLLMYAHDNLEPGHILDAMKGFREWNSRHKYPQIVVSSPKQFFEHMEKTYGPDAFPVIPGDWAGLWETANFVDPHMPAVLRYVRDHAPALEALSSIAQLTGSRPYAWHDLRIVNNLILEDDDQGISGAAGMVTSHQTTKSLYFGTLSRLCADVATSVPAVIVFNPSSWKRSDIVDSPLRKETWERDFSLIDAVTERAVPCERTADHRVRFVASDVPALGYKVFYANPESKENVSTGVVSAPDRTTIENEFYRVVVDAKTGDVSSIFDNKAGREIVDHSTSYRFNGLCDSPAPLWSAINPVVVRSAQIATTVSGVTARIMIQRGGTPLVRTEISLHAGVKRIDLSNHFATRLQGEHSLAYYLPFPLALDKGRVVARIDNANAFLTPGGAGLEATYLPGAYTGSFIASRATELHEGDAYGVAVAQRQSACVLFGSANRSVLFSKVITDRGGRGTEYAESPAELQYDYAITSYSGAFDPVRVKDFGEAHALPLWGNWYPGTQPGNIFAPPAGPLKDRQLSFLEISAPNVKLSAWKRVERGDADEYLLRFQEVAGTEQTDVTVKSRFELRDARLTDMVEQGLKGKKTLPTNPLRFSIGANETLSLRTRFSPIQR